MEEVWHVCIKSLACLLVCTSFIIFNVCIFILRERLHAYACVSGGGEEREGK